MTPRVVFPVNIRFLDKNSISDARRIGYRKIGDALRMDLQVIVNMLKCRDKEHLSEYINEYKVNERNGEINPKEIRLKLQEQSKNE